MSIDYNNSIKNITIVTSLLNCSMQRSVFTREERYLQTKNTLETIRAKIPNGLILLIDITKFTQEEEDYFKANCDVIINESNNVKMIDIVHDDKNNGERCYLLTAIDTINILLSTYPNITNIFKVSGRYFLNQNFNYNNFCNDKTCVFVVDPNIWSNAVATCLFKLSVYQLNNFYNKLVSYETRNGMCMETWMFSYVMSLQNSDYIHIPIMGMTGKIAPNGIEGNM